MHDLLIVLRTFAIHDPRTGRRVLRPGTTVNIASELVPRLVAAGYVERVVPAAPLFRESTDPPDEPMKRGRKPKEPKEN